MQGRYPVTTAAFRKYSTKTQYLTRQAILPEENTSKNTNMLVARLQGYIHCDPGVAPPQPRMSDMSGTLDIPTLLFSGV